MAQALPPEHAEMESHHYQNHDLSAESDDSDNDIEVSHVPKHSPKKQNASNNHSTHDSKPSDGSEGQMLNGSAQLQTDRYGFLGGKEFTDPEK